MFGLALVECGDDRLLGRDLLLVLAGAEADEPLELDGLAGWRRMLTPAPRCAGGRCTRWCLRGGRVAARRRDIPNATRVAATGVEVASILFHRTPPCNPSCGK